MASTRLRDFASIVEAVRYEMGIPSTDTETIARIKLDVNMVYEHEVVPYKRWTWLTGNTKVVHKAYYASSTCAVTVNSATVTLATAPSASLGSFRGYLFAVDGFDEIYEITAHAAGSTTVTLSSTFLGNTASAASFKIWKDRVTLPTDLREVVEVSHQRNKHNMIGQGFQEFRQSVAEFPKAEDFPLYFNVNEYYDPSSVLQFSDAAVSVANNTITYTSHGLSTGEIIQLSTTGTLPEGLSVDTDYYVIRSDADTIKLATSSANATAGTAVDITAAAGGGTHTIEALQSEITRYRVLRIHPSLTQQPVTLHIDYTKEIGALIDDGDEPIMPTEDRIVLVYGALERGWNRMRNPEAAQYNRQLFQNKLARMAGKVEDGFDRPKLTVDHRYLRAKRGGRIGGRAMGYMATDFGGESSYSPPTYLEGVTINGANITGNVTVAASITIDGRDISADGSALDAHIAATSGVHGATGSIVGTTDTQTLTNKTIDVDDNNIVGTADRVAVYGADTYLDVSAITTDELSYLDDVGNLTSATLTDNTASATNIATWSAASFDSVFIHYSLSRGSGNREVGLIHLTTDGTNAGIAVGAASTLGTLGVTFSADVSGGLLRLRYTTTSTGTDATFKYKLQKWLA